MRLSVGTGLALGLVAGFCGFEAQAATIFEKNFWLSGPRYDGALPACEQPWALALIASRFAQKESVFWNSNLQIVHFERIKQTAYRPWANDTVPRRYCSAVALISDGVRRPVHYLIVEDGGMAGQVDGVEWCVVGLDRNWAYHPACKMARP